MKLSLIATAVVFATSAHAFAESLEAQAAKIIQTRGFWCPRVANINPTFTGQSANKNSYRVFCDNGSENATYLMEVGRGGSYVNVKEY